MSIPIANRDDFIAYYWKCLVTFHIIYVAHSPMENVLKKVLLFCIQYSQLVLWYSSDIGSVYFLYFCIYISFHACGILSLRAYSADGRLNIWANPPFHDQGPCRYVRANNLV